MRKMWSFAVAVLSGLLLLNALMAPVSAADFSADLTDTFGEKVIKGKIHVLGDKYCMELNQDGKRFRVIADPTKKTSTLVQPDIKEYRVLRMDDFMARTNDPFCAYDHTKQFGEEAAMGVDSIDGYECEKIQITMNASPLMTKWVSKKLNFPVKIMAHGQTSKIVELSNISEGSPSAALFEIPDGYKAWVDPESLPVDPPEWAGDIATAPVVTVPFMRMMKAGEIVRVKVEPEKSLVVKGENQPGTEATAKVIPFKGINPTKAESKLNNFAQQGTVCERRHEMSGEADEFVIRVYSDSLNVIAKWQPMFERVVSAGEEIRYPISGTNHITTRFINLSDGKATASFEYYSGGEALSDEESGKAKYRKIELDHPWTIDGITRQAKGDEMVIKVEEGKMQIKLGQFDPLEF